MFLGKAYRFSILAAVVVGLAILGDSRLREPLQQDLQYTPSQESRPQLQLAKMVVPLNDSQAAHASGTYIPGVGVVVVAELIRGPNSTADQPPIAGVLAWGTNALQTYGPQLDAVPSNEAIALSIDFYDYPGHTWHQLLLKGRAATIATPGTYSAWLDGKPYARLSSTASPSHPSAQGAGETSPAPTRPTVPLTRIFCFTGGGAATTQWARIRGEWRLTREGFAQIRQDNFDFVTLYKRRLAFVRYQVHVKYLSGLMGGGLVFNASSAEGKAGAQMISYSEHGTYVQWGYFDHDAIFRYQGGASVPSGADGRWHTIDVQLAGDTYSVSLDGTLLESGIPLVERGPGYVGLLASRPHVLFDYAALGGVL
jgi:hypothetical protein